MSAERDPLLPDPDDFDRQLRDLISGQFGTGRIRELSAAERSRQAEKAARSARRRQARLTGPRRLRIVTRIMSLVVVIGLLGYGVYALHLGMFAPASHSPSAPASAAHSRSAPPSAPATAPSATPAFTVADPFSGTPAEGYLDGPAGIVRPRARQVGGYSAAEVAAAYLITKRLLVAADLNQPTLHGGRPAAFIRLLTSRQRPEFIRGLDRKGADARGRIRSTRAWVVSFAPGTTAFVGKVVKVHGYLRASGASEGSRPVLRISFNYLFVYPVERPDQPPTRIRIVAHLTGHADFAQWTDPGGPLQAWWLPSRASAAGARCDIHDGFVHPAFPASSPGKVKPSGAAVNPYQLSEPDLREKCAPTTGT